MIDRQAMIDQHRQRVEREMAELPPEPEHKSPFAALRAKRDFTKPRRSSARACSVLLARLDHVNLMARNPGYSINR